MANKKNNKKKKKDSDLGCEIIGILFITFGIILTFSILSSQSLGMVGKTLNIVSFALIGLGSYFLPLLIIFIGLGYIVNKGNLKFGKRFWGIILLLTDMLLFIQIYNIKKYYIDGKVFSGVKLIYNSTSHLHGGIICFLISIPLFKLFEKIGCYIIFSSLFIISMMLIMKISISDTISKKKSSKNKKNVNKKSPLSKKISDDEEREDYIKNINRKIKLISFMQKNALDEEDSETESMANQLKNPNNDQIPFIFEQNTAETDNSEEIKKELEKGIEKQSFNITENYKTPSIELLKSNTLLKLNKEDKRELINNANKLEETLQNFGVDAKVIQVSKGPSVTRFELQPSPGVKVSKIVNLSDDISLSLAASAVRIEAPIPGKSAIGIEVPNKELTPVLLREVIESNEFNNFNKNLAFCLGKDISGNCVVTDLAKMPHVLIAGATGSGKSVCINTLIVSLLYKYSPQEVKLLMIDPKVVELSTYNGIPHLLIPVVTDPKKAAGALSWAVNEMTKRYNLFAENNVKNIDSYNELYNKGRISEKLPYIVIIIDELADLMMVCAKDVEDYVMRLAQMARAAGMHLVIATQRPSVDVITGLIKANIPTRISFAVSSQIDSRTILDITGAEKLIGKGDMLFSSKDESKPIRIQGAFISEEEVENVVNSIKMQENSVEYKEEIMEQINTTNLNTQDGEEYDELMEDAIKIVVDTGQASTSLLQRRLRIGYNRAARLIEQMEEQGIISGKDGSKPRQVLISRDN